MDRGPTVGARFGPYEILEVLGEGGMGAVFRARSERHGAVALKVIRPELAEDETLHRRFAREACCAAKIRHRHVVPVLDVGDVDGVPYLGERYVAGGTLHDRIQRHGPLPLDDVVSICLQVASGLDAMHAAGIVHRDLKPANILLGEDGCAFITDFGVAKDAQATALTRTGQTLGSIDYMAPEQIRGQRVTALTDVYALGCVVCECLSGEPPFGEGAGMDALWAHLRDEPRDPCAGRDDVPPHLSWAALLALEKEPSRRPPTPTAYARMVQMAALPANGRPL